MRNPYASLLATAWKYARNERKQFVLIYTLFIIANIIVALNPLFYGWFVNELQLKGSDVLRTGWIYIIGFISLRLLEWVFHGPARIMERRLAFNMSRNFIEELYHKVLRLPVKWHQDHHSGSTISKIRKAYEALRDFFQNGFVYLYTFGRFFFSFAAMLYFSPLFGFIGIVLGIITIWIVSKFDKPYIETLKDVNEKEHDISSSLFDNLSNIVTVITLRLEKRIEVSLLSKINALYSPFQRTVVINEWKWFTAQMLVGLIYVVTTFGYIYQHWQPGQPFLIGGLVILLGYVNQFTGVFNEIAGHYTQIVKYDTDVQNARDVERAFERVHKEKDDRRLPIDWQDLSIQNLNFERNRVALSGLKSTGLTNINMHIRKGKRIALIGESGSGKSTLLALLRGLYTPKPGNVITANDNIPTNFESISSTVTLFPQDPEIFENTVHYNITLGLSFSEKEIKDVCETAQFTEVIQQLPLGLETIIQEKGVNLSGGQKQRLALVRGILAARSSEIILMDEPTSSIDPRTEKLIYLKLFRAFKDKAIVSSLHRLHLLRYFDYVYILKNGEIIEEGNFEYLRENSPIFKDLWKHQTTEVVKEEKSEI